MQYSLLMALAYGCRIPTVTSSESEPETKKQPSGFVQTCCIFRGADLQFINNHTPWTASRAGVKQRKHPLGGTTKFFFNCKNNWYF